MLRPLLAALVAAFVSLSALAEPYDAGRARVELISERTVAVPGETVYLALDKVLDPGWHVYWRNAGDAGFPPRIDWTSGPLERTELADFTWPIPETLPLDGGIMDYGYSYEVTLPFAVTIPETASGEIRFEGVADYLICEDICIPETAPISFTLQIGDAQVPDEAGAAQIARALDTTPAAFEGEAALVDRGDTLLLSLAPAQSAALDGAQLRFFPYNHEIVHSADQSASYGPDGASLTLTRQPRETLGERLDGVLVAERADGSRVGYEISAPLAAAAIDGTSGRAALAATGANAGAGALGFLALIGFALLGGLILNLMPCVLPVLTIKAHGLLHAAKSGEPGAFRMHGLSYTAGVLAAFAALAIAFLALRGVGEFWALGSLLQYPSVVAGLAIGAFLLGLWLLGTFELGTSLQNVGSRSAAAGGNLGAFATGALAATAGAPCVGPFVAAPLGATLGSPAWQVILVYLALGLGLALPFLILSFVPNAARFLPKPGAWMERVKQFFAFPMFLTAAALLFVLGDQSGTSAVAWLVMGAALIGFGIWALKAAGGALRLPALAAGAAALIAGAVLPVYAAATASPPAPGTSTAYAESYETEAWSPQRVAELQAEGRGVFVDFTATWCMICQANKRTTLTRPEVLDAMQEAGITFLVADFTSRDPVIAEELERRGRPGVPMYLLYAPGETEPKILPQTLSVSLMLREIAAASEASRT